MTSPSWLLGLVFLALGCQPAAPPRAPVAKAVPAAHEERVLAGGLQYRFRASRFSNLFYTVDCLAGTVHCARDAFEELAAHALGGLDDEDHERLAEWKLLRRRYQGRVEKDSTSASPFPLPRAHVQVERRVRLAGYLATNLDEYAALATMLLDVGDVQRARAILARFETRFDRYWEREAEPALASSVARFAAAARTPALGKLVDEIEAFYAPEVPRPLELTFELILRPHGNHSNAEQLAHVSVIEVEAGASPTESLDVVLHEVFHYFLSQVPDTPLTALMDRFASDPDPLAYVAQGTLDEGLASAFGNGLVLGTLDPARLARRRARPRGMYADVAIDAMAKAAIDPLARVLSEGKMRITDPQLETTWLQIAHTAFPSGAPPQAYLRPFVGAYAPELESGVDSIYDVMQVGHSATDGTLDPTTTRDQFATRPHWNRALFLRPVDLPVLDQWTHVLSPSGAKAVRDLARLKAAFVHATVTPGQPTVFVFVAPDAKALTALVSRFAAASTMHPGLLAE